MADWQNGNDADASKAKLEAQKLAWAPFAFQAARIMRNSGMLACAESCKQDGATLQQLEDAVGDYFSQKGNPDTDNRKNVHYAVYVLVDAGVSMGVFDEVKSNGQSRYVLTLMGYFLLKDRITTVNMDFTHDVCYNGLYYLEDALKTAKPTGLHKAFGSWETVYSALADMTDQFRKSWFAFDHYFSDSSFPKALPIVFADKPKKLLDIGGNTGKWAIKCAKYNPDVKVTIADLPGQVKDAQKNISEANLADRVDYACVNLLDHNETFPTGYNAVWMSQFLDCFGPSDIMSIVSRAKDALTDDGTMYIMETFVDLQRYETSKYCLDMTSLYFTAIANGKSRMYHSTDMIDLVEQCGMKVVECIERVGLCHSILKCKKK